MRTYSGLAVSEEHRELAASARAVLADRYALGAARAAADGAPPEPPEFWKDVVDLGWLGLHLPEQYGGQGFGVPELAILVEELGRSRRPGSVPADGASARRHRRPRRAGGPGPAAAGAARRCRPRGGRAPGRRALEDRRVPRGQLPGARRRPARGCCLCRSERHLAVVRPGPAVAVAPAGGIDATRRPARVTCSGAVPEALLRDGARMAGILGRTLAAAEAAGGARACTEAAVAYAKERVQFGSPVGSFQAVKHMCANMLVATELATAAAWDAARAGTEGPASAARRRRRRRGRARGLRPLRRAEHPGARRHRVHLGA